MNFMLKHASAVLALCAAVSIAAAGFSQVSPSEIPDPQLKALEQTYLQKLVAMNRAIEATRFPFMFSTNRYAGLEPKDQAAADRRGLEFVNFHGRQVLKLTGNYNTAYNTSLLTPNQRATKTFDEVMLPVLRLLPNQFSAGDTFDAFGFEIAYHVRTNTSAFGYEGKEILVVVMDKSDAFTYVNLKSDPDRQQILNRAEIFLNGKPFGLQVGTQESVSLEALNHAPFDRPAADHAPAAVSKDNRRTQPEAQATPPSAATQGDAEQLQSKYQSQLDAFAAEGATRFHFVQYAPPSIVLFRDQVFLQLTLRNTQKFQSETTSIYKRAAQSFDLFFAPQLKPFLEKLPNMPEVKGVSVTILNDLTSASAPSSSEALEFFFPLGALRQFAGAEITNQELINQSVVLVNEVRIALDLQRVE